MRCHGSLSNATPAFFRAAKPTQGCHVKPFGLAIAALKVRPIPAILVSSLLARISTKIPPAGYLGMEGGRCCFKVLYFHLLPPVEREQISKDVAEVFFGEDAGHDGHGGNCGSTAFDGVFGDFFCFASRGFQGQGGVAFLHR